MKSITIILILMFLTGCSQENNQDMKSQSMNEYINSFQETKMEKQDIGFVFIHGAGLGSWIWEETIRNINSPFLTLDFPGRANKKKENTKNLTLDNYTVSILKDIDGFKPKKIIIVAHSIGGILGLEIARLRKERIIGFVAIGATIPENNGSFISSMPFPNRYVLNIMMTFFGTLPPENAIKSALCSDLTEAQTQEVVKNFVPESIRLYRDKIERKTDIANPLYIVLSKDKDFPIELQKKMSRNLNSHSIVELDSGHLPMISRSKDLAKILNQYLLTIQ